MIPQERLIVITGHYGSGKTELAVNLAFSLAAEGKRAAIADLDLVNPYFCTRERAKELEARGVRVVLPTGGTAQDLPSISPAVSGLILDESLSSVLDIGGDPAGATVLKRFAPELNRRAHAVWMVLNANRPETAEPAAALRYLQEIEERAGRRITGLVNNTHLLGETGEEDILRGAALAEEVARLSGVPFLFSSVERGLAARLQGKAGTVFPLKITMNKPWECWEETADGRKSYV